MPTDFALRAMNTCHRGLLRLSRGHVGWNASNMPVLELVTTGRRTGRRHSVMLTSPTRDGDAFVVVASRGGDDRHPAWLVNLRDNPEVEVSVQGRPAQRMRARIATAAERRRLWPDVIADHRNYAAYQLRTSREIPLVLLEPQQE